MTNNWKLQQAEKITEYLAEYNKQKKLLST